jgi:hypothetical protein
MEDKLKICSAAIVSLLKSWTGLVYLSMNGGQSIRNFLDTMRLPFEETRVCIRHFALSPDKNTPQKIVIETLFEIFRVELPKWFSDLVRARGAGRLFFSFIRGDFVNRQSNISSVQCGGNSLVCWFRHAASATDRLSSKVNSPRSPLGNDYVSVY